jgi:ribosomal protein L37AE/L43A
MEDNTKWVNMYGQLIKNTRTDRVVRGLRFFEKELKIMKSKQSKGSKSENESVDFYEKLVEVSKLELESRGKIERVFCPFCQDEIVLEVDFIIPTMDTIWYCRNCNTKFVAFEVASSILTQENIIKETIKATLDYLKDLGTYGYNWYWDFYDAMQYRGGFDMLIDCDVADEVTYVLEEMGHLEYCSEKVAKPYLQEPNEFNAEYFKVLKPIENVNINEILKHFQKQSKDQALDKVEV